MPYFYQAVSALIQRIERASVGANRLIQNIEQTPDFSFIDWLDAQPIFPKFYWQSRDGRETVAALGQLHTFTTPLPAYAILAEGQRVWGGRSFDGQTEKNRRCMASFFFLPQIELISRDGECFLAVNLTSDFERTLDGLRQLRFELSSAPLQASEVLSVTHIPNQPQWRELVGQVLDGIEQQQFKKVVLARKTSLELKSPIRAAQLLKASIERNRDSFHFLMALDDKLSFLGSTPERLYQRQGTELYTEALAGTIGRDADLERDTQLANWLTQDSKNVNENQYVVDDIIERLTPHAIDIDVESQLQLVKLRQVQHLKRNIHATLKHGVNGVQLLSALQPTAAVAGLPRDASMAFIHQHEPFARGWYAGSMGYISHTEAQLCVAIRSALVVDNQVQLFAGAGIVPGSVAEHEWQELDNKTSTLLSLITEPDYVGEPS
ncbi:isochorismate synthase [Vibrio sp. AK197]